MGLLTLKFLCLTFFKYTIYEVPQKAQNSLMRYSTTCCPSLKLMGKESSMNSPNSVSVPLLRVVGVSLSQIRLPIGSPTSFESMLLAGFSSPQVVSRIKLYAVTVRAFSKLKQLCNIKFQMFLIIYQDLYIKGYNYFFSLSISIYQYYR